MKKQSNRRTGEADSPDQQEQLLSGLEKAASAILQQVKILRTAEGHAGDAVEAHAAISALRERLGTLARLAVDVAAREGAYSDKADKQILELESAIREACAKRDWRVDGQWPTLYIERAIAVEVSEAKRSVTVAGKKLSGATAEGVALALEPLVRELLPRGFAPKEFIRDLAAAYDSARKSSTQLPVFDLFKELVVRLQGSKFWRDAKADVFVGLSADQFRARLTATLERGVTNAPDGREIRLLPPLDPKDGLFMYQPAESRYGFIGRIEFVPRGETETS